MTAARPVRPGAPDAHASSEGNAWADACLAVRLLALDPAGLGGAILKGGPGPAREDWTAALVRLLSPGGPVRKAPMGIADDALLGGLDLAASLTLGRPVARVGLMAQADGGLLILPSAERLGPEIASRLAAALDQGEVSVEREGLSFRASARIALVAYDESRADVDEDGLGLAPGLADRLAFHLTLSDRQARTAAGRAAAIAGEGSLAKARARLARMGPADREVVEGLCAAAEAWGVGSPRAALFALRVARAHAALRGAPHPGSEDAVAAARLVLAPRALRLPSGDDAAPAPPPPDAAASQDDPAPEDPAQEEREAETGLADLLVEAVRTGLPPQLLAALSDAGPAGLTAGARNRGGRTEAPRGAPRGSRPGRLKPGDRLDVPATLRAAAPWQTLRGAPVDGRGTRRRLAVRAEDFRLRRFTRAPETTTIIAVDASGSTAVNRLAEAKGAVELLLARAYVDRAHVALVAFRGVSAEVLLPPTRSLARAKRCLSGLAGGGGTPLAAGVEMAWRLALAERARRKRPRLVILTDGRPNIGLDGAPGREQAATDALAACRRVAASGLEAIYVDAAPRPAPDGDRFAKAMGARYAPLPLARAGAVAELIGGGARGSAPMA